MAKELKLSDRKILYYLNSNSRLSNSFIGKKCGLSKQVVKSKIDSWLEKGVIKKFITIFDSEKAGFSFYNIYIELDQNQQSFESLAEKLAGLDYTCWIVKGMGKWNLIVCVLAKGNREFRKCLGEIFYILGNSLIDHEIFTMVDALVFPNKVLFSGLKIDYDFQGYLGSEVKEKLDGLDYRIMKELSQNARIPSTELSRKLGQKPNLVNYRIKRLLKSGLISKFTLLMDVSKLGFNWYYVLMKVKQFDEKREKQLEALLKGLPGIFYLIRGVGNYNLCFEVHAKSSQELEESIKAVNSGFGDMVKKIDVAEVLEEIKCDFYPPFGEAK